MNARAKTFALLALGLAACSRSKPRALQPLAYVSDEESGTVVVIDTENSLVKSRIVVGKRPRGLVVSRDGKRLYVALSGSPRAAPGVDPATIPPPDRNADGIGVVDLGTNTLIRTLRSGQDPESFDLSPDDSTLYVSNEETGEMTVLDVASGSVRGRVAVGGEPEGVRVRPDGKVVCVTSEHDNQVSVVDTNTFAVIAHVSTGGRPRGIVFTNDGRLGFVTNEEGKSVTVFDPNRFAVLATIPVEQGSATPSGPKPMGAVLSRDEKTLYVTTGRGGALAVIDVATNKQVRTIDGIGNRPWGIARGRDDAHVYTANGTSNDFSIVNVVTGNVDKRIEVGGLPWGVAVMDRAP